MTAQQRRVLDLIEQVVVAILYGMLVIRLWPSDSSGSHWLPLLILPSEGLVVLLLLIRRRTEHISVSLWDWFVAAAGTFLVLSIDKGAAPVAGLSGPFLMIFGLVLHIGAKLSLWRSFGLVAANRGVRSGGLYQLVRHPMYAGYILSHMGYLMTAPSLWNLGVYLCAWSFLVARIYAEERILSQDELYRGYKEAVRYRLMPGVF